MNREVQVLEGAAMEKYLAGVPENCRFKLPSGGVILLKEPLTSEELEAMREAAAIEYLEGIYARLQRRAEGKP